MKVSVIVPVYNAEQYIEDAVESIMMQSLIDFEVILVDDCGKDRSGEICDELSERDPRIKVIHSEKNGGICKARNIGMKAAKGEYIAFCDDDDVFLPGLLKDSYDLAMEYDADMVKFGRKLIDINKENMVIREKYTKGTTVVAYSGVEKYSNYFGVKSRGYLTNLWNGIYKLEIIRKYGLEFDEGMKYGSEDMDFSVRLYDLAKTVVISPETYYVHYRRDASSTSRKFSENKIQSMMKTAEHELVIWNKMPATISAQVDRNRLVSEYLRNVISIQLLHEKCPYSDKEKVSVIKSICTLPQMKFNKNLKVLLELFKKDKKSWVSIIASELGAYRLLLLILSFYRKCWGDRWE